jgi:hypothetical protein
MKLSLFIVIFISFLATATTADAKLLPRYQTTTTSKAAPRATGNTIAVSPKFMSGKTGLKVAFSNVGAANTISYMLSYESNGKQEGIAGSVRPAEGNTSRDLLFGTCSSGKCVYHKNIKNCVLTVTAQLKNGKKQVKKFNVKV